MKLLKDKFMVFCFGWGILFFLLGFIYSHFSLLSLGLLPFAIYEFKRTEGLKNTKPISLLMVVILVFQFLHASGIFPFPFDISSLLELLPVPVFAGVDPFIFLSVASLVILSLLLIRYTWGSVTKFLAIALLVGSLLQGFSFWSAIQAFLATPEGQRLLEGSTENIRENLRYRLKRELF